MLANSYAQQAYSNVGGATKTDRSGEYDTLARITSQLKAAAMLEDYGQLVAALDANRRMWVTISSSVADTANSLPPELKAGLFYLAEFTDQHTRKVLREEARPDVLIETNLAVMRGLNGMEK